MRTIQTEPLTHETFAPFGNFYVMTKPDGYSLNGEIHRFFPDRISESYGTRVGFSPILVKKIRTDESDTGGISHNNAGDDSSAQ